MRSFCNESFIERYDHHLTEAELNLVWSTIVSVFLVGGVTGSLSASWLADRYGRRGALIVGNVTSVIGAILFFMVPLFNSVELFILGRLIVGNKIKMNYLN